MSYFEKKHFVALLAISASPLAADFDDAGTDYTTQSVNVWVDDYANQALDTANVVSCLVSNSRPDLNINKTYTAKLDENKCGYQPDADIPNKIMTGMLSISKASSSTPAEGVSFFEASDGTKFVSNVIIEKGPGQIPPYGINRTTYYSPNAAGGTYNSSNSPFRGFVDISEVNNDVQITTASSYIGADNWGQYGGETNTIATYIEGNVDNVKFISQDLSWNGNPSQVQPIEYTAGRADENFYFLAKANASGAVTSSICQLRNIKWTTVNDYKIYNKSDGSEVEFTGSFDFKLSDGTMGYLSSWGIWLDGFSNLDPSDTTTITNAWGPSFSRTLQLSAGELSAVSSDGDRQELNSSNSIFNAAATKLQCIGEDIGGQSKCLGGNGNNFPISYANWAANGQQNVNRYGANHGDYFYLTGRNPASGFEPMTLYYDTNQDGLDSNDEPIRFDFEMDYYDDKYRTYGSSATASFGNADYPYYHNLGLVRASDVADGVCTINDTSSCDNFNWSFGPQPWNQTPLIKDNGDVYEVSDTMYFDFTYDATKDRNSGITFSNVTIESTVNPTGSNSCTNNNDGTWNCTLTTTPFNGTQLSLGYNGYDLWGFPWLNFKSGWGYRYSRAFNPIDGTTLTDADGKEYVIKASNVREAFQQTNLNNCIGDPNSPNPNTATDDLTFSNVSELGYNLSNLGGLLSDQANYPLPTQTWADKPSTVSSDSCPVVHGKGNC